MQRGLEEWPGLRGRQELVHARSQDESWRNQGDTPAGLRSGENINLLFFIKWEKDHIIWKCIWDYIS